MRHCIAAAGIIILPVLGLAAAWFLPADPPHLAILPFCAIAGYLFFSFYQVHTKGVGIAPLIRMRGQAASGSVTGDELKRLKKDIIRIEQQVNDWKSRVG
jgi:hypothetical protein